MFFFCFFRFDVGLENDRLQEKKRLENQKEGATLQEETFLGNLHFLDFFYQSRGPSGCWLVVVENLAYFPQKKTEPLGIYHQTFQVPKMEESSPM